MRVLVVSHACVTPINQQYFAVLAEQTGWTLSIVSPAEWQSEYGETIRLERWPAFQGSLIPIPVWGKGNVPLHAYRTLFMSLLRRENPDVIFVQHEPYALATAQVYTANHLSVKRPIGFFTWQNISKNYPPPFCQMEQLVLRNSHFAISGSEGARKVIKLKGYDGVTHVIPTGVDASVFRMSEQSKNFTRQFRRSEGDVVLGFVGRITKDKGLSTLLEALSVLEDEPWTFVVVGAGSYEVEFDERVAELGLSERVSRLGYVPHTEAPHYLRAFDLLLLPSETQANWKEQFGRVIIEAMACGTPVLGSNSGEIPNLIQRTGGGWIFPERDVKALASMLRSLIARGPEREKRGYVGQEYVLSHYTHEVLAQRFAKVVRKAAKYE